MASTISLMCEAERMNHTADCALAVRKLGMVTIANKISSETGHQQETCHLMEEKKKCSGPCHVVSLL